MADLPKADKLTKDDYKQIAHISAIFKEAVAQKCKPLLANPDLACNIWRSPPLFTTLRVNTFQNEMLTQKKHLEGFLEQAADMRTPILHIHDSLPELLYIKHSHRNIPLTEHPKWVIIDVNCGAAVLRGAHVFVCGILGAPSALNKGDLVSVFVDLDQKCRKGLTEKVTRETLHVANGVSCYSRTEIFCTKEVPSEVGIKITESSFDCVPLAGLPPCLAVAQNLPSIVVGHVLNPKPGDTVLDMCAAPGGKTSHLACLMNNQGILIALDKTKSRMKLVNDLCNNMGFTCVKSYAFNSVKACSESAGSGINDPPFRPCSFDCVLLDAPCSGLGNRPILRSYMTQSQLESYSTLQQQLFRSAVNLLKPGGSLVYSTCTITLEENEQNVVWALRRFPEISLCKQEPHLGGTGIQVDGLTIEDVAKLQRWFPFNGHNNDCNSDTIGFFIAKFTKMH